jgi:hypothetical protein
MESCDFCVSVRYIAFARLLAIFTYFTAKLSAMQVRLETEPLENQRFFKRAAHVVVAASLVISIRIGILIPGKWFALLLYHYFSNFR